jgi:hypothetical protein
MEGGSRTFGEGGRRRWCRFNVSVSARDERRWDEALPKDETEIASLSWFYGKEACHDAVT